MDNQALVRASSERNKQMSSGLFSGIGNIFGSIESDIPIESPIASPRTVTMPGTGQVINPSDLPPGSTINVGGNVIQSASDAMQQAAQSMSNAMSGAASKASTAMQSAASSSGSGGLTSMILSSRMMSGAIGLICIASGLFMFQHTRELIVSGAKTAAKVAAVA